MARLMNGFDMVGVSGNGSGSGKGFSYSGLP